MDIEAAQKLTIYRSARKKNKRLRKRRPYIVRLFQILVIVLLFYFFSSVFGVFERIREFSQGEKFFSGKEWEAYMRLRNLADQLERMRVRITVYDNMILRHARDTGHTGAEKQLWVENRRQLQVEFNRLLEDNGYNVFMEKNGLPFTRREELPEGLEPLPPRFVPYQPVNPRGLPDKTSD